MERISHRVAALAASQTLAMTARCRELADKGIDVINLSVGEPDFDTPDHIKAAAREAIDRNFSHYSPVAGYLSLRQAIADKLSRENGLRFGPEQIVVGNGAKQELSNLILATVNPGDEVIVPTPAWVSYFEMVKLAGGRIVDVPTSFADDFKLTPARLEAALTPRTRVLMMCSPSNPTGSVYSRAELEALAEVLERHPGVLVISDEIYEHILYSGSFCSIASLPGLADRVAIVNGVSKAYAMTGWRIGYTAAPPDIARAVAKLQGQTTSGASSIAQKAAEAAYTGPQDCVRQMCEAFRRRRDLVASLAADIPGMRFRLPEGAFYLFPDVTELLGRLGVDDSGLAMLLLDKAHVATVAGTAFSAPGHLRISYATSEDRLVEAFARIKNLLS